MRIVIFGFTRQGGRTIKRLLAGLSELGYEATGFLKEEYIENQTEAGDSVTGAKPKSLGALKSLNMPVSECVAEFFIPGNGIIFIGAAGIAVRLIAPLLRGKDKDPAVAVVDEQGKYSISLLSGHLGGANDMARVAAHILGAVPVITTATDLNDTFAADLFAKRNHLLIEDINVVKKISAALLDGYEIGFFSEFPVNGQRPLGLAKNSSREWNIAVTVHAKTFDSLPVLPKGRVLCLFPKIIVIGIGCRRGTPMEAIEQAVDSALMRCNLEKKAVASIASIDLKKNEPGILAFAKERQTEFVTFSAEQLSKVEGTFSGSEFVFDVTGVSNVCERAAILGCGDAGRMLMGKTVFSGVTVALAVKETTLSF